MFLRKWRINDVITFSFQPKLEVGRLIACRSVSIEFISTDNLSKRYPLNTRSTVPSYQNSKFLPQHLVPHLSLSRYGKKCNKENFKIVFQNNIPSREKLMSPLHSKSKYTSGKCMLTRAALGVNITPSRIF